MNAPDPAQYRPDPEYFRSMRQTLGMTQKQLATKLLICHRQIRKYETGRAHFSYATQYLLESYVQTRSTP